VFDFLRSVHFYLLSNKFFGFSCSHAAQTVTFYGNYVMFFFIYRQAGVIMKKMKFKDRWRNTRTETQDFMFALCSLI